MPSKIHSSSPIIDLGQTSTLQRRLFLLDSLIPLVIKNHCLEWPVFHSVACRVQASFRSCNTVILHKKQNKKIPGKPEVELWWLLSTCPTLTEAEVDGPTLLPWWICRNDKCDVWSNSSVCFTHCCAVLPLTATSWLLTSACNTAHHNAYFVLPAVADWLSARPL